MKSFYCFFQLNFSSIFYFPNQINSPNSKFIFEINLFTIIIFWIIFTAHTIKIPPFKESLFRLLKVSLELYGFRWIIYVYVAIFIFFTLNFNILFFASWINSHSKLFI